MTVITAPDKIPDKIDGVTVFLAGTIDLGNSDDWQSEVAAEFANESRVTFLNPRRASWDGEPDVFNPNFVEQVNWELKAMERADIITMFLAGGSQSPVSMLELGIHMQSGKLIAACEDDFHRHGNVYLTCKRYGVPLTGSLVELVAVLKNKIKPMLYVDRPCPLCKRLNMTWGDVIDGYYCHDCKTLVAVPRARGVVEGDKWIKKEG